MEHQHINENNRLNDEQQDQFDSNFSGAVLADGEVSISEVVKAAVQSANDAIIITEALLDEPGPRIEWVNPAFTRMTGYSYDEVIGSTPRMLQGPNTDRSLLSRLKDDLKHGRSFYGETINYRKDGSEYYVEWRITPLFKSDGKTVAKWAAIQRDVTGRVKSEQERDRLYKSERTAREEAERASRMKDEFLATLSHELRTPLNAIVGWAQILMRNKDMTPEMKDGAAIIERNARAQSQIIEDLLDMSRIIAGKVRLDIQQIDLPTVIEAGLAAVQHAADTKNVTITKLIDQSAGPVSGDSARLQQIVWNLLNNAVKFTPANGKVQIQLERVNSHVEFSVSDTGIGIKPEFLPHVFDRFRQEDGTTTRKYGGLGIGLSIVKHLVELHGGSVRAKSPGSGLGSTFMVALPISLIRRDDASKPYAAEDPDDDERPSLKNVRILCVDDEADARDLMAKVLTDQEAEVVSVSNGSDAIEALRYGNFDVLISDIGMHEMDGYSLIRHVRQMKERAVSTIHAIAVTAFARQQDRRSALKAGFDMHIAKPLDAIELLATIARVTSRKSL